MKELTGMIKNNKMHYEIGLPDTSFGRESYCEKTYDKNNTLKYVKMRCGDDELKNKLNELKCKILVVFLQEYISEQMKLNKRINVVNKTIAIIEDESNTIK